VKSSGSGFGPKPSSHNRIMSSSVTASRQSHVQEPGKTAYQGRPVGGMNKASANIDEVDVDVPY